MKYPMLNRPIDKNWVPYRELSKEHKLKVKEELWAKYQEEKRAKLYDALEVLRDNKRYLKLSDDTDNELMMKMWSISHNKEFI
tara:strand:+ start:325 stop:573 length:249 start_codon:yes stop_codon:yes gene_type:complete